MSALPRCGCCSKPKRQFVGQHQRTRLLRPNSSHVAIIRRAQAEAESDVDPMTGTTYQNPEVRLPKPSYAHCLRLIVRANCHVCNKIWMDLQTRCCAKQQCRRHNSLTPRTCGPNADLLPLRHAERFRASSMSDIQSWQIVQMLQLRRLPLTAQNNHSCVQVVLAHAALA
jgi:hypothetical protein